MYYYIVDPSRLSQRQFERIQNQLYSFLSDYRISGETSRVTALRTIPQLVDLAINHGSKTIVAVGTDETLQDVVSSAQNRDVVIGYIPLVASELSEVLGLHSMEHACKTIAGRRIAEIDVGRVNGNLFIGRLSFGLDLGTITKPSLFNFKLISKILSLPNTNLQLLIDQNYKASLPVIGGIITNSRQGRVETSLLANPSDGILDILLLPRLSKFKIFQHATDVIRGSLENISGTSVLHAKKIEITAPEGLALRAGQKTIAKVPAIIEVLPKNLKIIVGRDRSF